MRPSATFLVWHDDMTRRRHTNERQTRRCRASEASGRARSERGDSPGETQARLQHNTRVAFPNPLLFWAKTLSVMREGNFPSLYNSRSADAEGVNGSELWRYRSLRNDATRG